LPFLIPKRSAEARAFDQRSGAPERFAYISSLPRTSALASLDKVLRSTIRIKRDVLQSLSFRPVMRRKIQAIFEADEYKSLSGPEKRLVRIIAAISR